MVAPIGVVVLTTGITEVTHTQAVITADGVEATMAVVTGVADQTRTTTVDGTEVTRTVATGVAEIITMITAIVVTGAANVQITMATITGEASVFPITGDNKLKS